MKFPMHRCYACLLTAVATLTLISIPGFVGAQISSVAGWDLVGAVESPESGRIEVYLMGGLVRGSLASREFLEKVVWQKDGKTITARNVVDCHSKVRKLVLLNEYKRHHVDGSDRYSLVRSQEPKDPAMKAEPDTLAEMIYNEVCFPGSTVMWCLSTPESSVSNLIKKSTNNRAPQRCLVAVPT